MQFSAVLNMFIVKKKFIYLVIGLWRLEAILHRPYKNTE